MITVKPICDETLPVEVIQDPVSVILQTCCEDYELVMMIELLQEFYRMRSRTVISYPLHESKVNQ